MKRLFKLLNLLLPEDTTKRKKLKKPPPPTTTDEREPLFLQQSDRTFNHKANTHNA